MKELLYNELLIWYEFRWSDNGFNEFHGVVEAAVFVSILEYMLSVCRLRVVGSYVPSVFIVSDGYVLFVWLIYALLQVMHLSL